ncbi:MAG: ECF transporter S component [Clostridia bacterium]|nr:ECF transporter S component [Clostridia bacterium]
MNTQVRRNKTEKLVLAALLTALVVLLQYLGAFVKFGPFSISLVLIPIVIGAATCGATIGAWLGFVFGVVVLASGDAAAFLAVDVIGTVITVLVKGTACGFAAGLVYKALERVNMWVAVIAAALVCPIVNTGVFLIGCFVFFMDTVTAWAGGTNVGHYMIFVLVGGNFLFEVLFNIVLSPGVVRLLNIKKMKK